MARSGNVWLIKGFFDAIPMELDEAAKIDGAGHSLVFFQIILPLVRPIIAVTSLLALVGVIGEFMLASIFLRATAVKTLAVGLYGRPRRRTARTTSAGSRQLPCSRPSPSWRCSCTCRSTSSAA